MTCRKKTIVCNTRLVKYDYFYLIKLYVYYFVIIAYVTYIKYERIMKNNLWLMVNILNDFINLSYFKQLTKYCASFFFLKNKKKKKEKIIMKRNEGENSYPIIKYIITTAI